VIDKMHLTEITICYGLTEGSPVITQTRVDDDIHHRVATVGRALPGIELRLVDPKTNAAVEVGEKGEVCCRGYNVMKGYYRQPEETSRVIDADGWLHSGDLGVMDEKGYLTITGRCKDMIIRGGENIYPREIEEFLYHMEGISDVQVVGVANHKYGEEVAAFVIRKQGAQITEADVRDYCRGKISRFKIPQYVFFVDAYPLTASGKVQKYLLREMACELVKAREQRGEIVQGDARSS
nr:AMP-binding protein [bacterium]